MLRTTQAMYWICLLALVIVPVSSWAAPSPQQDESATIDQESEAEAPEGEAEGESDPASSFFEATTVTATGTEVDVFSIATPVSVIPEEEIERKLARERRRSLQGTARCRRQRCWAQSGPTHHSRSARTAVSSSWRTDCV